MKYCNEDVAKWSLPCGYPRQWIDGGGCIVDDDAPVGIPCVVVDGKPYRDTNGLLASPAGYIVAWEPLCGGGTITAYASLVLNDKGEAMNICKELNKKFPDTDLYRYRPVDICCIDGRLVAIAPDGRQVLVVL